MLAKIHSAAHTGFNSQLVEIECDITNGLPSLVIVGLGNKAIDEAKERVRSAISNSGLRMPRKRITLNLAPADLPKDGTAYDLPMAVATLVANGQIEAKSVKDSMFIGELALNGDLRPVPGALSYAQRVKQAGIENIYLPAENAQEAALIKDIQVVPVENLQDLYRHLIGEINLPAKKHQQIAATRPDDGPKLQSIYGQETAKRALEIAAAGHHNILLNGPPGAGKTMLAKALLSILPEPTLEEIIEITKVHSLVGANQNEIVTSRPFRTPHHTASNVSLIGGGQKAKPGEISLSHNGVLFLDELPEFKRNVLEVLRQPLEDREVTISRARRSATYPARFMMVATQNPCPCGFYGDEQRDCTCTPAQIARYNKKISGPLLDRIDLVIDVKRVDQEKLLEGSSSAETSQQVYKRIKQARDMQHERFDEEQTNSEMTNKQIKKTCQLQKAAKNIATNAMQKMNLSARGYMRLLKVARTIADLEHSTEIKQQHVAEALQYRA